MTQSTTESYDVIVIGGGPAGATVGTLLAQSQHRVLLLEKTTFPRYKVGESLLPATVKGLAELLGCEDKIAQTDFTVKRGATFSWGQSEDLWTLNFGRTPTDQMELAADAPHAYNVPRADFDALLLDHAREQGVDVRQEHRAVQVRDADGRICGVDYQDAEGQSHQATARYVVDASGQRSLLSRRVGQREFSEFFRKIAVWGYYEGGKRLPPPQDGNVLFEAVDGVWIWYIPLSNGLTSVGAVIPADDFEGGKDRLGEVLQTYIGRCPLIEEYLADAKPATEEPYDTIRVCSEYSYCQDRFWEPGGVLVGDAACFVDVLLSSGVHLATYGALLAARSIDSTLRLGLPEELCMNEYEARLRKEYALFYDGLVGLYDMNSDPNTYTAWLRGLLGNSNGVFIEWPPSERASGEAADDREIRCGEIPARTFAESRANVEAFRQYNGRQIRYDGPSAMRAVSIPEHQSAMRPSDDGRSWVHCGPIVESTSGGADGTATDDLPPPPEEMQTPLFDYGKLYRGHESYLSARPGTLEQAQFMVRQAARTGTSIRVRASGHTFSGATLPRQGEVLIRTSELDYYRFEEPGTITVGAGATMWDVRDFVPQFGLWLPVYNGGWSGPTVGGYINAGGMGLRVPPLDEIRQAVDAERHSGSPPLLDTPSLVAEADAATREEAMLDRRVSVSELHGGFWEHVASVTLIDGHGEVRVVHEDDAEFPWLFGAYGQLGLVVEAKLKLMALRDAAETAYPVGQTGRIPRVQIDDPALNDLAPAPGGNLHTFWFSYLVSTEQEDDAWQTLGAWAERHTPFLEPREGWVGPEINGHPIGYRYVVSHHRFHPPLLYTRAEDFVLMGLMVNFEGVGRPSVDDKIFALEEEFVDAALAKGFHLYPQAENIGRRIDYERYYGTPIFGRFRRLKERLDPQGLFNGGVIFPSEHAPLVRNSSVRRTANIFQHLFAGAGN